MEEIYENILLNKSNWDDDNQCFIVRNDDVNNGLKNLGYKEYVFGGYLYVYSKKDLSSIEIKEYEREAKSFLDNTVDVITKEINKRILDKILKR